MAYRTIVLAGSLADMRDRLAHACGQDGHGTHSILELRRRAERLARARIVLIPRPGMTHLLHGVGAPVQLIELPGAEYELSAAGLDELRQFVNEANLGNP